MSKVDVVRATVLVPGEQSGYQPAFGRSFANKRELKEHIRELRYERGIDMIEVGNEKAAMKALKPPTFKPDTERAYHELKKAERGR